MRTPKNIIKKLLNYEVKQNLNQTTKAKNRLLKENEVIESRSSAFSPRKKKMFNKKYK